MICNYDECPCRNERPCKCNDCEKGIMILVSIIGGLVFAAVVVLLFINNFLAVPGFAGWTALISALVYLAGLIAAAVSDIKGIDINDVIKITNENAKRVYKITV